MRFVANQNQAAKSLLRAGASLPSKISEISNGRNQWEFLIV